MRMKSKFTGFSEAQKLLNKLPERTEQRVLQQATDAGATVMKKYIRSAAPSSKGKVQSANSKKYGTLRSNIRRIRLRRVPRGTKSSRVDTGKGFWGLILQVGTRYIPANPWFTTAFNNGAMPALSRMREVLVAKIEKEAVKLANEVGALRKR